VPATSCLTVTIDGHPAADVRGSAPYVPASNLKLLVASAALARLGPNAHFTTTVYASAPADGVVAGDLVLVGGGDPLLATADYLAVAGGKGQPATSLEALADRVKAAGITTINGSVVGDEARYDSQRYIPTWPASYLSDLANGPLSALDVNDGFASWGKKFTFASNPATNAALIFTHLLQSRGITVHGSPTTGYIPKGAKLVASIVSAPLSAIVGEMLTTSDNYTAEMLVKEIGRTAGSATTARGLFVEQQYLTLWGLNAPGIVLHDGSGLDPADAMPCQVLVGLLARAGKGSIVWNGLAVAGKSGTLATRFTKSAVTGRLIAKTGTLDGVSALSGVLPTPAGHTIIFSFVVNGPPASQGPQLQDALVAALALSP
jgi:D-alanyl-D-alanine carboxypeptidase/D-alanyl-D-alanine-endopeptidase (penicillin-binding protein 4)